MHTSLAPHQSTAEVQIVFAVALDPLTREVLYHRRLRPMEPLDERAVANHVASLYGAGLVGYEETGYIPACCGDVRVEFRPLMENEHVLRSGENFIFDLG